VREGKAFVAQAIAQHYRCGGVDALNHQHASPGLACFDIPAKTAP
jgi:hypothetical protein